jgi:hypothetical protein
LAVTRGTRTFSNLGADFVLEEGDDLVVVAEALGDLEPLEDSRA